VILIHEWRCTDELDVSGASRISRSARALPIGTLRPAIVLYDEPHPLGDDIGELQSYDLTRSPDLLLIMGTSLKVHGLKRLVKEFAKVVHAKKGLVVFVNATPPSKEWEGIIDMHVHGETDRWVRRVEEEWRKFRPQDWETQTLLDGEVIQVIAKTTCKPKGLSTRSPKCVRANLAVGLKTSSKGNIPPEQVQLPTPRSSQSPRKSPVKKRTSSNLPSSPLSSISDSSCQSGPSSPGMAPPTPLSPSKRRANVAPPPPEGGVSPTKRSKAIFPPSTGISGTPGRGNLFASPTKAATAYEWVDEEVFGSPVLKVQSRSRRAVTTGKENNPVRSATRMRKPAEKAVLKTRKTTAPAVRRRTTSTVLAG